MPTAQYVHVQVANGLPTVTTRVHDGPIPTGRDPFTLRDRGRKERYPAEFEGIGRVGERGHVPFRDDKDVHGRLRMNVAKGHGMRILGNDLDWQLASDNAAKQTGVTHASASVRNWQDGDSRRDGSRDRQRGDCRCLKSEHGCAGGGRHKPRPQQQRHLIFLNAAFRTDGEYDLRRFPIRGSRRHGATAKHCRLLLLSLAE